MQLISATAGNNIANNASVSGVLQTRGADRASIMWTADQVHDWKIEFSHDNATWFTVLAEGLNEADLAATAAAAGNYAVSFYVPGVRFVRLTLTNKSGGAAADFTAVGYPSNRSFYD